MPVFSCQQIAKAARKDAKTIRLWCAHGFVPGAKRKRGGAGRHWRIEGKSAATIADLSLRAARDAGHSRERKRTLGGEVVPSEALQRFQRVKDRARLRRDETRILYEWATSRGECFDEGEFSRRVLTDADRVQQLAFTLADFIVKAEVEKNHAQFFGRLFGWSRATFYRKFGTHLRMALERAKTLNSRHLEGFKLDTGNLSPKEARQFNSQATNGRKEVEDDEKDPRPLTAEKADLAAEQWQRKRETNEAFEQWVRTMSAAELAATIKAATPAVAADIRAAQKRLKGAQPVRRRR
jgi:hypothetical protein